MSKTLNNPSDPKWKGLRLSILHKQEKRAANIAKSNANNPTFKRK